LRLEQQLERRRKERGGAWHANIHVQGSDCVQLQGPSYTAYIMID